jgi:hypothetical protein
MHSHCLVIVSLLRLGSDLSRLCISDNANAVLRNVVNLQSESELSHLRSRIKLG